MIGLLLAVLVALASPGMASTQPVHAPHAIVVSVHELSSRAGLEIMQAGGNAIDAAVATGFALAVVHPLAGNLGGGGFMLIRLADGRTHFIDYREKAPAAATANMYLDRQGNVIENASVVGYKAIAVPGSVAGMACAEKEYGKLTLGQVLAPPSSWRERAIRYPGRRLAISGTAIWRNSPSHGVSFSATETTTSKAKSSASRSWRALSSVSPAIQMTFITVPWRVSWPPRSSRAAA